MDGFIHFFLVLEDRDCGPVEEDSSGAEEAEDPEMVGDAVMLEEAFGAVSLHLGQLRAVGVHQRLFFLMRR